MGVWIERAWYLSSDQSNFEVCLQKTCLSHNARPSLVQQLLIRKCVKRLFSMLTKKTQMKWRGLFLYLLAFWMAETKKEKRKQSFVLAFYTPTSVCVFSLLWSLHFLWYWQGEFVEKSRASSIGDHFQYSYDLNGWFRSNTVPRN